MHACMDMELRVCENATEIKTTIKQYMAVLNDCAFRELDSALLTYEWTTTSHR